MLYRYTPTVSILNNYYFRVVAGSRRSGVQRGSRPFAGAWGRPPVSFFFRARRAQRDFATALCPNRVEGGDISWDSKLRVEKYETHRGALIV